MSFPQIRMESTIGKIELSTQNAYQTIKQPESEITIEQPRADLDIETTPGKLSIDQTKAWEDMDLKHIFRRIEEFSQNGYQDWMEGVARRAQEGDDMMKIEVEGSPIPEHAKSNSANDIYDFNIGFVPSHFSVSINYILGKLKINWIPNKPIIQVKVNKPQIEYNEGKVDIKMKEWPQLKIDFIGLEVDEKK